VLKGAAGGVDNSLMPDLWKALGDVYGEGGADAPPVRREPAASERAAETGARFGTALPLDDDLAAALSAALVNAPTPGPEAVAAESVTAFGGASAVTAPAPLMAPVPLTPPAPVTAPITITPPAPVVPAPPAGEVQGRVTTWIAEIEDRNRRREEGPDLAAASATGPNWSRIDDDIIPAAAHKRRFRK
jgi:hypothetical protein